MKEVAPKAVSKYGVVRPWVAAVSGYFHDT